MLWPRATISNDWSSGTPAFSIVASWRVKNVTSFSDTRFPPRNVWRLILVMRTPWRRRLLVTTVSDAAFVSPRTWRLLRSTPSHRNVCSLTSDLRCAVAVAMVVFPGAAPGRRHHSFVTASTSSSDIRPALTFRRPDWRRLRTPSFCARSAISSALPLRMIRMRMSSEIGITS